MSRQSSEPKKQATIYEGLLFLSMCALITGIIFLVLKLNEFNWDMAP
ncbi:MAG: hypothetical protein KDA65_01510 [Planctomycetaceae bacterium]|nr:hypothetical protein [Planctomycetaceae bacterium]